MELGELYQGILRDMSDGVLVVGRDSRVRLINPALCQILALSESQVIGRSLASFFFDFENVNNDEFVQTLLNAVTDKSDIHKQIVPYATAGGERKQLHVTTSFLYVEQERFGVVAVISDITEYVNLQSEIVRKSKQVQSLLDSVVSTLSSAIDERSHYTVNHTRNMVRCCEAFLAYLRDIGQCWIEPGDHYKSFLMSIWLHDVGKLVVPLEVMDKASRLGSHLNDIQERFRIIKLMKQVACLKGEISEQEYQSACAELDEVIAFVAHINSADFLSDTDLQKLSVFIDRTYVDEFGAEQPWFTEREKQDLFIVKGTLTAREREQMQNHAASTARILSHIVFPDGYELIPFWASSHHEFLNGKGYPRHLTADAIPKEVRLITILDIYEALTAKDRPYKKPMQPDRAFKILHSMASEGALDEALLEQFEASRAWELVE